MSREETPNLPNNDEINEETPNFSTPQGHDMHSSMTAIMEGVGRLVKEAKGLPGEGLRQREARLEDLIRKGLSGRHRL